MKKQIVGLWYKKNQELDLNNSYIRALRTLKGGLLIDDIFFNYTEGEQIYSFEELKNMNQVFYVKNTSGKWSEYKTFSGLIKRLNNEITK